MTKEIIEGIIAEWVEGKGFFLVELDLLPGDRIMVFIDGEAGVTIDDCVSLSRFLEHRLDREMQDFELNVSSAGMDRPLRHPRQFVKALGKQVEIRLKDGKKQTGILKEASETHYIIEPSQSKQNKKKTPQETVNPLTIAIADVREVRRLVTFS